MSGPPQSFQRRTDDLYMLKTRNLVYQDVNGTYPTSGGVGYVKDTVGNVGWSSTITATDGNLRVKGDIEVVNNLSDETKVVINGQNGDITTDGIVTINGDLIVSNAPTVKGVKFVNITDDTTISQVFTRTVPPGQEQLMWNSTLNGVVEPLSGWSALLSQAPIIFRTVDTGGLSGATLTLAQNMNALLNLFYTRGIFVQTLTNTTALATVFNTPVSIRFNIGSDGFTYTPSSYGPSTAVPYSTIRDDINTAAVAQGCGSRFVATYIDGGKMKFDISLNSGETWSFTDASPNGLTAQFFMNHIGFSDISADVTYPNFFYPSTSPETQFVLQDFSVIMPTIPIAAPTNPVLTDTTCTFDIPPVPTLPPIAIQQIGIYWCRSDAVFSTSPNVVVPNGTTSYTITDLSASTSYNVAVSYRSAYDDSSPGPVLTFTTTGLVPSIALTGTNMYSVELTEDVNWLATPSYGSTAPNYGKSYVSGVKFNVATVYSAIWTGTLNDLTQISQIQSVTVEFYAGAGTGTTGARFYTGTNPQANILDQGSTVDAKYGDAAGVGGSVVIFPDADGLDMLHEIFNADEAGAIDTTKNMTFGWFCSQGGLRNCEMTRFNVIYMSMGPGPSP